MDELLVKAVKRVYDEELCDEGYIVGEDDTLNIIIINIVIIIIVIIVIIIIVVIINIVIIIIVIIIIVIIIIVKIIVQYKFTLTTTVDLRISYSSICTSLQLVSTIYISTFRLSYSSFSTSRLLFQHFLHL